jgi:hypothetical protein
LILLLPPSWSQSPPVPWISAAESTCPLPLALLCAPTTVQASPSLEPELARKTPTCRMCSALLTHAHAPWSLALCSARLATRPPPPCTAMAVREWCKEEEERRETTREEKLAGMNTHTVHTTGIRICRPRPSTFVCRSLVRRFAITCFLFSAPRQPSSPAAGAGALRGQD